MAFCLESKMNKPNQYIPAPFCDYPFASTLESDWAQLFDTLGLTWDYTHPKASPHPLFLIYRESASPRDGCWFWVKDGPLSSLDLDAFQGFISLSGCPGYVAQGLGVNCLTRFDVAALSALEFDVDSGKIEIARIVSEHPDLSSYGWRFQQRGIEQWNDGASFDRNRSQMGDPEFAQQVCRCLDFIRANCKPSRAPGKFTSYGLKHQVEAWAAATTGSRPYISNGAFIAAALIDGYRVKRELSADPNCRFYMTISAKGLNAGAL
jgi:hypothetical protein